MQDRFLPALYSISLYLLLPLLLVRLLWRSIHEREYRERLPERLGFVTFRPRRGTERIGIHAVSLGEVEAAVPLVEALLCAATPSALLVTTTTAAGARRARACFGDRVAHAWLPFDTPGATRRFFDRTGLQQMVFMETELWPNLLEQASARGCRCLLLNARLSQKSAAGYARFSAITRRMLSRLSAVGAQTEEDADRFLALGSSQGFQQALVPVRLSVTGSLKYELSITPALREQATFLAQQLGLGARPLIVAGSTHEGEEELLLAAFERLRREQQNLLLVLAPRQIARCRHVKALCEARGLTVVCRSDARPAVANDVVLLLDSFGELRALLASADIAVAGGSFIAHGGHNPLEAAAWSVPVISGPHIFNFEEIYSALSRAGAVIFTRDADELAQHLRRLLLDAAEREQRGAAGREVVALGKGALARSLALLEKPA